jgi:monoamine oxidase
MGETDTDIIVIGAGAAGLAAARATLARGLACRVLEAKDRIGGRAFTDMESLGVPWDAGAHWLHDGTRNRLLTFAREAGIECRLTAPTILLRDGERWAAADVEAARRAYDSSAFGAIAAAGRAGRDIAAADVLPDHPVFRPMFDSWYAAQTGTEPHLASTLDEARYRRGSNHVAETGYGELLACFGSGLPVTLNSRVLRVSWQRRSHNSSLSVIVETGEERIAGRAVIVTVSTGVLAAGAIAFDPPLPEPLREAIRSIPAGAAEKVAFRLAPRILDCPPDTRVHFLRDGPETVRLLLRPLGHDVVIAYFAGAFARRMAAEGDEPMIDFACGKLAQAYGARIRDVIVGAAATHWTRDRDILGAYSCALPGKADRRRILTRPLGGTLWLAGEACAVDAFGTVHGAASSGDTAAREAAGVIGVAAGMPEIRLGES